VEKKASYEDNLQRLEEIITHLEKGEIPLEEGLAYFEEGISLLKKCQKQLDFTAEKIQVLKKDDLVEIAEEKEAE